jgi:hypothetical protein
MTSVSGGEPFAILWLKIKGPTSAAKGSAEMGHPDLDISIPSSYALS